MATKAQQNADGTVSDSVTKENQKGYANYEADNTKKQREMETKDAKFKETVKSGVEKVRGVMGFAKGGKIMKKMKRYEEGGEIESTQGQNKSIGDDVRSRAMAAMAAMEKGTSGESTPTPAPRKAAPKPAPKPAPKVESKPYQEKSGFELKKAKALGMKSGGTVKAKRSIDGIALRGKTRAK